MSSTTNKHPIKVGILEISSQNRAILEFFFSDAGKSYFKEVSLEKASAYIIDYDSLGAKESWDSTFKETNKPGIIISIKEVDLPSTIWLQKPLTVKALKEAGESIRDIISNEVSPKPAVVAPVAQLEEIEVVETESIVENITENIVESTPEPIEEVALETIEKDTPRINILNTEDLIEIPSKSVSQITVEEDIVEEFENTLELQENNKESVQEEILDFDDNLISLIDDTEETVEVAEESLLTVESAVDEQINKAEPLASELKEPELAMADTTASSSSTNFASSSNFVDIDLNLNNDDVVNIDTEQQSSTIPIDAFETIEASDDDDMDRLLKSLISETKDDESNGIVSPLSDEDIENTTNLLDLDFETTEEKKASTLSELLTDKTIITNKKSSIEKNDANLKNDFTDTSNELISTVDTPDSSRNIENEKINNILHKDNQEKPKRTAEEELQSLLEEIKQEAEGATSVTTSGTNNSNPQITKKYIPTDAEARWKLVCGENDITGLNKGRLFKPSDHLLASLIQNIQITKQSKQVLRMKLNGIIIVIDPETNHIYCDRSISSEFYANICFNPTPLDKIKVHQLDKSEIRLYRKKMKEDIEHTHYIEAFIWTTSLLTSRGRLPKNTNININIRLTSWPNLTRVEKIPHMMQIAALLHKNNWSLLEISKESGIQNNYIIAFYNAALALNMIQIGGKATSSASLDLKSDTTKNRSFLSRFLKRLTE